MSFDRLQFTKDWKNDKDFPTVQTNEEQVRADMQLLHDEARDSLNGLMDGLENQSGAGTLGAVDPEGNPSTVQAELDSLYNGQLKAGALPVGGDAGFVLAKKSDTDYDTEWKDMANALTPLKNVAEGVAGLDAGGRIYFEQVPDNLKRVMQYCWKRTTGTGAWTTEMGSYTSLRVFSRSVDGYHSYETVTCNYGTAVAVSSTGELTLAGETGSFEYEYGTAYLWNQNVKGKYFLEGSRIFYMPEESSVTTQKGYAQLSDDEQSYMVYVPSYPVSAVYLPVGSDYAFSSDRNAYPDYGTQDDISYEYAGVVLENAASAPKTAFGTYVGNGKYGEANPCEVNLDFTPKFFGVQMLTPGGTTSYYGGLHAIFLGAYNDYRHHFQRSQGKWSWYADAADLQGNCNGCTYIWFALG